MGGGSLRLPIAAGLLLVGCLAGSSVLANLAPAFLLIPFFLPLLFAAMAERDWLEAQNRLLLSASLGVLVSCSVSLRPTAAPFAGILLLIVIGRLAFSSSRSSLSSIISSGISASFGAVLFALPFSLDLHRFSGTFLYPFLGRGNHASGHGQAPTIAAVIPLSDHLRNLLHEPVTDWLLLLLVLGFAWELQSRNRARVKRMKYVFSGLLLTYGLIVYQTGGVAAHRYAAPLLISFLLSLIATGRPLALPAVCKRWHAERPSLPLSIGLSLATIALIVCLLPTIDRTFTSKLALREKALHPSAEEIDDYRRLQAATPAGSVILCTLQRTNLLNVWRNKILLNDQPGMVAPPLGWPFGHGGRTLTQYLSQHGIGYVAVMREALNAPRLAENAPPGWARITRDASTQFYDDLNDFACADLLVYKSPRLLLYKIPSVWTRPETIASRFVPRY